VRSVATGLHSAHPTRAVSTSREPLQWSRHPAHPRSRGEHADLEDSEDDTVGSSPLARGALWRDHTCRYAVRLIPARAGSTCRVGCGSRAWSAHPRSRGEHQPSGRSSRTMVGSSPLARGAPPRRRRSRWAGRLIPARAGSTRSSIAGSACPSAHPRSRGEHTSRGAGQKSPSGSSPLARGALSEGLHVERGERLIPTRAGSTYWRLVTSTWRPAHPRSRGEHTSRGAGQKSPSGSSPLARGALDQHDHAEGRRRLIPARAGSTACHPQPGPAVPAHPRSRGSTGSRPARPAARPAHPRSRGEHSPRAPATPAAHGSSPLARGARRQRRRVRLPPRLIPARAGSTSFSP